MKAWYWQLIFILLCVWDTLATQTILAANLTGEANPLMDTVIRDSGWVVVWAIKIGFGAIFACYIPILWKRLWGRPLVTVVFLCYSVAAGVHVLILNLP